MMFRFALVLSIGLGLWAGPKEAPPGLRLPATVRPVKQSAELTLGPGSDTFQGRIDFDLDVREPRDVVWINATGLTISSAMVNGESRQMPRTQVTIKVARAARRMLECRCRS